MAKIGRNDPCPCGSGKKYKRCCLPVHQAEQAAQRPADPAPEPGAHKQWWLGAEDEDFEELDRLSNRVPELIEQGRLDEAEEVCQELLRRYPDEIDGVERLGHVHEARGDHQTAAAHYRKAAAFIRDYGDPEDEHAAWLQSLADRLDPP
jgi:tetratricopeptide (TPR) repeat protein